MINKEKHFCLKKIAHIVRQDPPLVCSQGEASKLTQGLTHAGLCDCVLSGLGEKWVYLFFFEKGHFLKMLVKLLKDSLMC